MSKECMCNRPSEVSESVIIGTDGRLRQLLVCDRCDGTVSERNMTHLYEVVAYDEIGGKHHHIGYFHTRELAEDVKDCLSTMSHDQYTRAYVEVRTHRIYQNVGEFIRERGYLF